MQKTTITGGDLPGLKALAERIRGADRNVLVGVPADAKPEDDGTSMALVAATNEFGSEDGKIPERAFMRTGIARGRHKFERLNRISLTKIVQGTETVEHGLGLLGEMAKGEMQLAIKDSKSLFKPNAPSTIARKSKGTPGTKGFKLSDQPLKDTGNLEQSLTWILEGKQSAKAEII